MKYNELKNLIQAGESYHTEFKQTLDKSFIEEVCAFANSGGGRILLGVSDSGEIKGIKTDNSIRSRVQDTLRQIEPKLECRVNVIDDIIEVNIPEGREKPYGCSKGFFMRMGANSQKLSRNEIIEFFQKEGRIRFGELRHARSDFEQDFDPNAFSRFLNLSGISPNLDRNTLLRNLNCLTEDNQLTNAGVLFFARDIDFILNHAIVVCALYKGDIKVNILDRKDFKVNLVDNIDNAILFVKRHTNIALKIESTRHEEVPDYPEVALREAIINAVCHRDYFFKGSQVMVEVFENRVEISNPGGLPTDLKPEAFGTKSVTRNPLIASLLHRIDYIERMGTGIGRIRQAVTDHGGCTVEFIHNSFYTSIFRKKDRDEQLGGKRRGKTSDNASGKKADGGQEKEDNFRSIFGVGSVYFRSIFGENILQTLMLINNNSNITAKEIAENLKVSKRSVENYLSRLKANNFLERVGSDKTGCWKIKKGNKL